MNQNSKIKNRFLKEIKNNNICLTKNPKGTDIQWPKSYASSYYKSSFTKFYKCNKSPFIIQINERNEIIDNLWNSFFINPVVRRELINNQKSFEAFKKIYKDSLFDIIIIKNYKSIKNIWLVISYFKSKLRKGGIIIIENIHYDIKLVSKLFFNYSCKILDLRLNRFLIDNCIIEIKNHNFFKKIIYLNLYFKKYLYFIFLDIIYRLLNKFKNL